MSVEIRKASIKDISSIVLIHERNMPGLSSKFGQDYLCGFYKIIIKNGKLSRCLLAVRDKEIIGYVAFTQELRKTRELLNSLWSFKEMMKIFSAIFKRKIFLKSIINRLRFENLSKKRVETPSLYLLVILVKKEDQRQGTGRLLMEEVNKTAEKLKIKKIYVDTQINNLEAYKFYQNQGFFEELKAFNAILLKKT